MDFNFFENDILNQNLNMNLNKIIWIFLKKILKIFLKILKRIFQKYFKNISPNVIKKQVGATCVISFAPTYYALTLKMFFKKLPTYMLAHVHPCVPMCTHVWFICTHMYSCVNYEWIKIQLWMNYKWTKS
jgi:hypothetical protein